MSREIATWAERRYGLISRRKLLDLGLSPDDIAGRLAASSLLPAGNGVYYVGHRSGVMGQREALALADAGPGAALSGPSAAGWRGMIDPWAGPVHVTVPASRSGRRRGIVRHLDVLAPNEVTVVRGLACVVPERAVMGLQPDGLRQALQWLIKRGIELEPIVEGMHGRRGAKAFRDEVMQLVPQMAHTMSELEDRFLRLCVRYGLPLPVVNGILSGGDLLDCTWPGKRLVIELDGRAWHEHRDREDRARDRRRIREGRCPARFDWWDITRRPRETAAEVAALLAAT